MLFPDTTAAFVALEWRENWHRREPRMDSGFTRSREKLRRENARE